MAHPRLSVVRNRFGLRCGYCGVHENETGGELTIDHYRPVSRDGEDTDDNLVYSCFRCNSFKSDYWSDDVQQCLLHPLLDIVTDHIVEDSESGFLVAITERGNCHIETLHLNRPQLVQQRLMKQLLLSLTERSQILQRENAELRELLRLLTMSYTENGE